MLRLAVMLSNLLNVTLSRHAIEGYGVSYVYVDIQQFPRNTLERFEQNMWRQCFKMASRLSVTSPKRGITAKRNISVTFFSQVGQLLGPFGSRFEAQMKTIFLSIKLPVNRDSQNARFCFPHQQRHPKFDRDPPIAQIRKNLGI